MSDCFSGYGFCNGEYLLVAHHWRTRTHGEAFKYMPAYQRWMVTFHCA